MESFGGGVVSLGMASGWEFAPTCGMRERPARDGARGRGGRAGDHPACAPTDRRRARLVRLREEPESVLVPVTLSSRGATARLLRPVVVVLSSPADISW